MRLWQEWVLIRAWWSAHRAFGIFPDWKEYRRVRACYAEPQRFYHTWQHIFDVICFTRKHYGNQPLLYFALFYHDIVYEIGAKDNEEQSAVQWIAYARSKDLHRYASLKVNLIADLIRMTAKHSVEDTAPLIYKMMSDADMSIFLVDSDTYIAYARNVWREYSAVASEAQYSVGRSQFLKGCDPEKLYYTHQAKDRWKAAAANIEYEQTVLLHQPEIILF